MANRVDLRRAGTFIAAGLFLIAPGARAQSFDVASIKPVSGKSAVEGSSRSQVEYTPDSLMMRNIDLDEMIQWAYQLQPYQISAGNLLSGRRYDLRARSAEPASAAQLRLMLQNLLATRFRLATHREPKRTSVYELVVAKGGPKLPPDKSRSLAASHVRESLPRVDNGGFVFSNVSLADFAEQLSQLRPVDQPVLDRTGIGGVYDIVLKSAASAILQPDGPSLFTLIEEQLGLKLIAAREMLPVLVVDHAEPPSPD
jgi:uncharacterized protein (TIGR03435 family)